MNRLACRETHLALSMNQFIKLLRVHRFGWLRRFDEIILLTKDPAAFNRKFIWCCLILFAAKKAEIIDGGQVRIPVGVWAFSRFAMGFLCEVLLAPFVVFYMWMNLAGLSRRAGRESKGGRRVFYINATTSKGMVSGGSVNHIAEVVENFSALGFEPIYFAYDRHYSMDTAMPQEVVDFPFFNNLIELKDMAYNIPMGNALSRHLIRENIAFIYQRYTLYSFAGLKMARRLGIPWVLEYNGSALWMAKNWDIDLVFQRTAVRAEERALKGADILVVVSDVMKEELVMRGVAAERILVNPNGVNADRYSPAISGDAVRRRYGITGSVVCGFISTFGAWHGAKFLAHAICAMKGMPAFENVRFMLIGDGDEFSETKDIIDEGGMTDHCIFAGMVPQHEGASHLAACDIYLSPHVPNPDGTRFFGSPTKLFEYMAMGKAVIASRLEQIGDVLVDGETALLFEPGNRREFIAALQKAVEDPALRERLGRNARAAALEKHTWNRHTRRILEHVERQRGARA